ncbi:MAG: DUF4352 domain-containing protein [Erysipelotrichaceae bacterium]|nr:DUF4352 domain-containing protein [Erysipelotrichaceae bacterium]
MKRRIKYFLAGLAVCVLTACTSYKTITGNIHENVSTMFYQFTVEDCYSTLAIGEHKPQDGKMFVVVSVTIENTYKGKLSLTDHHFQLQTLSSSDDEDSESTASASSDISYVLPISGSYLADELPSSYDLEQSETKKGTLVFEMPAAETVFNFCSADYFNYGSSASSPSTGNTYFVQITPEAR